jgi:sulfide:quinone oxidoreductase
MLESEFGNQDIKWVTNSRINKVEDGMISVTQINADGSEGESQELKFGHCMILPAFRGIKPLMGIEGLVNPRGFVIVDQHQRNTRYENIFAVGVCVAIPPVGPTPVPVGVPKTGYMIESMVTASVLNIQEVMSGQKPTHRATWNAFCLADFGDRGMAFIAEPQIPPRNTNWSGSGRWVHWAKVAFEKYFLRKVRKGSLEPVFEKVTMRLIGLSKLRHKQEDHSE